MTDTEIIKALEVCVGIHNDCGNCPLLEYSQASDECMTEAMSNALDLINRQKAEIEMLENGIEELNCKLDMANDCISEQRAEAVKEFAERLKDMSEHFWEEKENFVSEETIDKLVKEMVGED